MEILGLTIMLIAALFVAFSYIFALIFMNVIERSIVTVIVMALFTVVIVNVSYAALRRGDAQIPFWIMALPVMLPIIAEISRAAIRCVIKSRPALRAP